MMDDFDRSPYTKKAFELAYAMIRIAGSISSETISSRLDTFAHNLLELFASGQYEKGASLIEESAWFIRLWTDLSIIHRHLGESLLLELSRLKSLSLEASKKTTLPESIEALFPTSFPPTAPPPVEKRKERVSLPVHKVEPKPASSSGQQNSFHYSSSNRQSAIIDFIKEKSVSGNGSTVCRMKEIQDKFPFVSERTLRYDLQKMTEQGLIERVGGGPMSAYRMVASLPEPVVTSEPVSRYTI